MGQEQSTGVTGFETGPATAEEAVPANPLPDQVDSTGTDPSETDSNEDTDDEQDASASTDHDRPGTVPSTAKFGRDDALSTAVDAMNRLPPCPIGAIELLTFFPHHTKWPEACLRLYRNGWDTVAIAKYALYARGTINELSLGRRKATMRQQVLEAGRLFFHDRRFKQTHPGMTPVATYDATGYVARPNMGTEPKTKGVIVDLAHGVVNWPQGQDRGIVTEVVDFCVANGLFMATVDEIPALAAKYGFVLPSDALSWEWDQRAMRRASDLVN